jgi:hypothetical protein
MRSTARSRQRSLSLFPLDLTMPHPYLTRRTEIIGFVAVVAMIGASCAFYFHLYVLAFAAILVGAAALAFAVYSQIRFGPRLNEVPRTAPWPPNSFRGWFGVFMFVVVGIAMVLLVAWRVLHGFKI